ncbi:hypothetical protein [Sphingomicrobium clamense]|uniref:Uncharacterized protein n=1 Tax=Sphingomicrobium clamense TaxID=2851013 RepID=A0ABS6V9J8_9SPHN|nr:hypothetical protein [Sphingomicrobium sp. B8]MBW0145748.1 hypothetical protein [Sphingomicrobium sp. B8]
MNDEELWKKRFAAMQAVRIGGFLIALVGLLVARGGVITEDSWPVLGAFLIVMGLGDFILSPKILKRIFDQQDGKR